jgi:hypothetical protein
MAARYISLFTSNRRDFDLIDIRKETYLFFPQSDITTRSYADAGFYYVGDLDISRCFRCGLQINKLRFGEDPFDVHQRRSPDCIFVKEKVDAMMQHLHDSNSDEDDFDSPDDSDLNVFHSKTDSGRKPIGNFKYDIVVEDNFTG